MYLRHISALILFLIFTTASAQMPDNFGKVTEFEKQMTSYDKDPSANAVVLYERGDNYFKVIDFKVYLVKEFHRKIKVLDEKNFDGGEIAISLYRNGRSKEKLTELKAMTHNGDNRQEVAEAETFTEDFSKNIKLKKLAFPNIQNGSILEYKYTLISPFHYKLTGWLFQSEYPVKYSEFNAKIPGKYVYNRAFFGNLELDINDAKVEKNCFSINNGYRADCEVLKYVMKDIPAFKAESDYMLASKNYISRIEFELAEFTYFSGAVEKMSTTWKEVDDEFKEANGIGPQLRKNNYFKRRVPEAIISEKNDLTKAKKIFSFIQEHFSWDGTNGSYDATNVRKAFFERTGSVAEINMSLINLLNAADIEAKLMLLSTRDNGLPKKTHPVIYDFNYFVAKVNIEGTDYLLDASDKNNSFGMIPFKALNHYGRVMDFEHDSYWFDISPFKENLVQIRSRIMFDGDKSETIGVMDLTNTGYNAVDRKIKVQRKTEEEFLNELESELSSNFVIDDYELIKERSDKSKVSERLKLSSTEVFKNDKVFFNPFLIRFFDSNPFQLDNRDYPIDFGYPRKYKYQMNIAIPPGYVVDELPKSKVVNLGNSVAELKFYSQQSDTQVAISFEFMINATYFVVEDYQAIKTLFGQVIDLQKNSLVVFSKTKAK